MLSSCLGSYIDSVKRSVHPVQYTIASFARLKKRTLVLSRRPLVLPEEPPDHDLARAINGAEGGGWLRESAESSEEHRELVGAALLRAGRRIEVAAAFVGLRRFVAVLEQRPRALDDGEMWLHLRGSGRQR